MNTDFVEIFIFKKVFEWSLCKYFSNYSISIHSFLLQIVCIDREVENKLFFAQLHPMLFYLDCQPMKKLYYLQYQYMPFFVASMAVLLYMPYVLFRIINTDMVSLRTTLGKGNVSSRLHQLWFKFHFATVRHLKLRIWFFFNNSLN